MCYNSVHYIWPADMTLKNQIQIKTQSTRQANLTQQSGGGARHPHSSVLHKRKHNNVDIQCDVATAAPIWEEDLMLHLIDLQDWQNEIG